MVASPRRIDFGLRATDRRGPLCKSPIERTRALVAWAEKRTTLGEARHIYRIDGFGNLPASSLRGVVPCLPPEAQSGAAEKRAKRRNNSQCVTWPHPSPPRSSGDGG